jgi:hypothetical protein
VVARRWDEVETGGVREDVAVGRPRDWLWDGLESMLAPGVRLGRLGR